MSRKKHPRKPTRTKLSVLAQRCNFIPTKQLVPKLARQYGVEAKARTFSPWPHVVAMLYAQFTHSMSLNDVCDALRHHGGKLLRSSVWDAIQVQSLAKLCGTAGAIPSMRAAPEQLYLPGLKLLWGGGQVSHT